MNEQDKDSSGPAAPIGGPVESMGSAPAPQQSFGSAPAPQQSFGSAPRGPGGDETMGSAPGPDETIGDAPKPAGSKNVPLLVGGGIALLIALAALFGIVLR